MLVCNPDYDSTGSRYLIGQLVWTWKYTGYFTPPRDRGSSSFPHRRMGQRWCHDLRAGDVSTWKPIRSRCSQQMFAAVRTRWSFRGNDRRPLTDHQSWVSARPSPLPSGDPRGSNGVSQGFQQRMQVAMVTTRQVIEGPRDRDGWGRGREDEQRRTEERRRRGVKVEERWKAGAGAEEDRRRRRRGESDSCELRNEVTTPRRERRRSMDGRRNGWARRTKARDMWRPEEVDGCFQTLKTLKTR